MTESENVATVQGNEAIFKCGTSEPNNNVTWYGQFYDFDTDADRCLYNGARVAPDYQSIFSVETIVDNVYGLRINHTTLSIAGAYICEGSEAPRKFRAELIVLGE